MTTIKIKQQPILKSITDFNGNVWFCQHVATYNNYTQHFNACLGSGSMAEKARGAILDNRHRFVVQIMDFLKEKK